MLVNGIVLAAGQGSRMGMTIPKAFVPLGGHPLILHTLRRFLDTRTVHKIIVVVPATMMDRCRDEVASNLVLRNMELVFQTGGLRRQDSVHAGLACIDQDCEIVVIHDGARPFVAPEIIDHCVATALREGAVVVGVSVTDTIKRVSKDHRIIETLPRATLWEVQTPQVFRTEIIREAYKQAIGEEIEVTDDSMLVERLGKNVVLIEGQRSNFKITVPEDLAMAEVLAQQGKFSLKK